MGHPRVEFTFGVVVLAGRQLLPRVIVALVVRAQLLWGGGREAGHDGMVVQFHGGGVKGASGAWQLHRREEFNFCFSRVFC